MTRKKPASGSRRRRSSESFRKLAVSMPTKLAKALEREVRKRNAPSVSALVSDAVEEKLERDLLQGALDEVWRRVDQRPRGRHQRRRRHSATRPGHDRDLGLTWRQIWAGRDSNPHPFRDQILSLARLPVPPPTQLNPT